MACPSGFHLTLSCNVFRLREANGEHNRSRSTFSNQSGFSVDFHINKWPRPERERRKRERQSAAEAGVGCSGLELFIGRRALNKIMVHADYSSAETCLPASRRAQCGQSQDYCGHVFERRRGRDYSWVIAWPAAHKVDLSKWSECCKLGKLKDKQFSKKWHMD